ncbi:MAG: D-2-hydroxyacid dehydrogenase [Burkholderiaceae bacterium]
MKHKIERVLFLQKPDVLEQQKELVLSTFAAHLPNTEVIFAGSPDEVSVGSYPVVITPTLPWLPEAFARIAGCEWVHFLSAGVEKIWQMPLNWSTLTLTKSTGVHGPQMSEYAIGALLHFTKSFDRFIEQSRERNWQRAWLGELTDQTLMVLGAGAVGESVAIRAKAFGMRVIAVKRSPEPVSWADVTCDFADAFPHLNKAMALVVCVPLTSETRGMVDHACLSALPQGAIVVDISRGGVVVEDAIADLLDEGHLRGAALDVFEIQPLPSTSRLWNRPNVLLTPHVSGTSPHYLNRALDVFFNNARCWERQDPMLTPVKVWMGY